MVLRCHVTKYAPPKMIFCISTKNLKLGLKFAINIRTGERFDFVTEGELIKLLVDKEIAKNIKTSTSYAIILFYTVSRLHMLPKIFEG